MSRAPTGEKNFNWRTQKIVLIDRDEQFRFFALGLFRHQRAETVQANGNLLALPQILAHHRMSLAFLELPEDDAPLCRVLKWLRHESSCPELPVLLLVKQIDRTQISRICSFGIHGILKKPLSGEQLMKAVRGVAVAPKLFRLGGNGEPTDAPPMPAAPRGEKKPQPGETRPQEPAVATVPDALAPTEAPAVSQPLLALPPPRPMTALPPPIHRFLPAPSRTGAASEKQAASTSAGGGGIETAPSPGRSDDGAIELAEPSPAAPKRPGGPETVASLDATSKRRQDGIEPVGRTAASSSAEPVETATPAKAARKTADIPSLDDILAAHLAWIESAGKKGARARLEGKELSGLDLRGANLASALLRRADFSACDFKEAGLHGADLRDSDLQGVCFEGADLSVARLRHARLRGSRLVGANLKGADLAGADLAGCDFSDAAMDGVNLLGTDLSGANLAGAKGLLRGQLDGVTGDAATRLPSGLTLSPLGGDDALPQMEGGDASANDS